MTGCSAIQYGRFVLTGPDSHREPALLVDTQQGLRVAIGLIAGLGRPNPGDLALAQPEPLGKLVGCLVDAMDDRQRTEIRDGPGLR